ncbi:MAG: MotE family protein [Paracoccaceae bacterium]
MPRRTWASGRGALVLIALLLVSSGMLRLGLGSGAAIALEVKETAERLLDRPSRDEGEIEGEVDITPELLALLAETQTREMAVTQKEAELDAREQTLALVEASIEEDLARLEMAEEKLRATMATADQAAETDIGRLTAVYENMKPDQASALFQLMEPSFAAGFLGRMRPDAAAAILAGLTPDLAYTISVVLAGRNADVPREPVPPAATDTKN